MRCLCGIYASLYIKNVILIKKKKPYLSRLLHLQYTYHEDNVDRGVEDIFWFYYSTILKSAFDLLLIFSVLFSGLIGLLGSTSIDLCFSKLYVAKNLSPSFEV